MPSQSHQTRAEAILYLISSGRLYDRATANVVDGSRVPRDRSTDEVRNVTGSYSSPNLVSYMEMAANRNVIQTRDARILSQL